MPPSDGGALTDVDLQLWRSRRVLSFCSRGGGCSRICTGDSVIGVVFGRFGGVGSGVFLYVKCIIFVDVAGCIGVDIRGFVFVDVRGFVGVKEVYLHFPDLFVV